MEKEQDKGVLGFMKRKQIVSLILILCLGMMIFMMTGCGGNKESGDAAEGTNAAEEVQTSDGGESGSKKVTVRGEDGNDYTISDFAGRWSCGESTLEDDFMYSGYLELDINEDWSFHTVDVGAGNPGIKGIAKLVDEDTISIDCSKDEDFDPFWFDMEPVAELGFKVVDRDNLQFSFTSDGKLSTLVFSRITGEEEDDVDWAEDDGEEGEWDDEDDSDI